MTRGARSLVWSWCAAALVGVTLGSCAPKTAPPVTPGVPTFPDFVFPAVPPPFSDPSLATRQGRAWQMLQAGDARGAEREFDALIRRSPGFFPAAAGLAYVLVAGQQYREAIARFDEVLSQAPGYAPALAGKGEALLLSGQRDQALGSFEAALSADPSLADLSRRIEVLRFDRMRDLVAAGKRAAEAGRLADARRAYLDALASSPESGFLYRDLGLVELRLGSASDAATHLRRAVELDSTDVAALAGLAEALEKTGDLPGAVDALERAYALDPSDATRSALAKARERSESAAMPEEFRAISRVASLTRGDLAALIGVRLQAFVAQIRQRSGVVATDVRGHWAATWIMSVTRAGLMDVYPNHTFQPRAAVRRADLALVVSRILAAGGVPGAAGARLAIADMSADHLSYPAVSAAVSAGVMSLTNGQFRPGQIVSGAEALQVIARLERLVLPRRQE